MKNPETYAVDPSLFTVEALIATLLRTRDGGWRTRARIVPDYMPSHPRPDTEPRCVVVFDYVDQRDGEEGKCFLRYSSGPRQGHFWDCYGDDYLTPELALIALLEAPAPPPVEGRYFSMRFRIPLRAEGTELDGES